MRHLTSEKIAANSSKILREIGMPVSLLGYQYVRYGIALTINDMTVLRRMGTSFYQAIAGRFDTTGHNVERAIRCAVEETCNRTTPDMLEKYFGNTISSSKGNPPTGNLLLRWRTVSWRARDEQQAQAHICVLRVSCCHRP